MWESWWFSLAIGWLFTAQNLDRLYILVSSTLLTTPHILTATQVLGTYRCRLYHVLRVLLQHLISVFKTDSKVCHTEKQQSISVSQRDIAGGSTTEKDWGKLKNNTWGVIFCREVSFQFFLKEEADLEHHMQNWDEKLPGRLM